MFIFYLGNKFPMSNFLIIITFNAFRINVNFYGRIYFFKLINNRIQDEYFIRRNVYACFLS